MVRAAGSLLADSVVVVFADRLHRDVRPDLLASLAGKVRRMGAAVLPLPDFAELRGGEHFGPRNGDTRALEGTVDPVERGTEGQGADLTSSRTPCANSPFERLAADFRHEDKREDDSQRGETSVPATGKCISQALSCSRVQLYSHEVGTKVGSLEECGSGDGDRKVRQLVQAL